MFHNTNFIKGNDFNLNICFATKRILRNEANSTEFPL